MATRRRGPSALTLRAYRVGFGDCFLLSLQYPKTSERHVLIDFGSTRRPKGSAADHMVRIAENIRDRTGGKLHAVVATHRHKDHISGFATSKGKGSGDIIRACKPNVVLMPWTEQPDLEGDATAPARIGRGSRAFARTLIHMHQTAAVALEVVARHRKHLAKSHVKEIEFIADDNLTNRSALENLASMGRASYLFHGKRPAALERLLPGVEVHVLGPPTLEQTQSIAKQRVRDQDEFWQLQAAANRNAIGDDGLLFPNAARRGSPPPDVRWFAQRLEQLRSQQLLSLVRSLDHAMNNTSLILLFKIGKRRLLFPGDAQIENWQYALRDAPDHERTLKELAQVDLYKVGHHGSLNATPRSLWDNFERRSAKERAPERLKSVLSTLPNVHGHPKRKTEVPRRTLVDELDKQSDLFRTDKGARHKDLYVEITMPLGKRA